MQIHNLLSDLPVQAADAQDPHLQIPELLLCLSRLLLLQGLPLPHQALSGSFSMYLLSNLSLPES